MTELPPLRTNQRNTLRLIARHERLNPGTSCSLGSVRVSRDNVFLKAVKTLEQKNLIAVERNELSWNYWKVKLLISPDVILTNS